MIFLLRELPGFDNVFPPLLNPFEFKYQKICNKSWLGKTGHTLGLNVRENIGPGLTESIDSYPGVRTCKFFVITLL